MSIDDEMEERVFIKDFKSLKVWERAHNLVKIIYKITERFPPDEKYRMTDQILRATSSISANLAEGTSSSFPKKTINYVDNAIMTANEVRCWLAQAEALKYISKEEFNELDEKTVEIIKMCIGYLKKIKRENS